MRTAFCLLMALLCCKAMRAIDGDEDATPKKRQIYREQVLPHAGGRIPDGAFETDRLFLNRLHAQGIAVPDGIVTEQREPQVFPYPNKSARTVYRIALSSDARYTADAGQYRHNEVPTIETTYLYPDVASMHQLHRKPAKYHAATTMRPRATSTPRPAPVYPVYRQFELHNPLLNQVRFQPRLKAQMLHVSPGKSRTKSYKSMSYQNFNIINAPVGAATSGSLHDGVILDVPVKLTNRGGSSYKLQQYHPQHGGQSDHQLFSSEFDQFFKSFDLHESGSHTTLRYRPYMAPPSSLSVGAAN